MPSHTNVTRDFGTINKPTYPRSVYHDKVVKQIACRSCGRDFPITVGELTWLAMKGYPEFKRCKTCRAHRRVTQQEAA